MSQALYRKWRSQTFSEVIGQEHVTQTLRNALRDGRLAHAYLFAGPRGTGKTSTARILAKALNCSGPETERPCNRCATCIAINEGRMLDLIEIDAASNNSVDDVRELRDKVGFRPSEGRYKVYIIDEVHMLSTSAFNALLKTLEEPPPHTRFVLATTEPHRIPATVLSRCQRFDFRRIPVAEIGAHLRHIVAQEGFQAEDEALVTIARSAQGCMRDAISLLDQMLSYGTQAVTLDQVQQILGTVGEETVWEFVDALAGHQVATGLRLIQQLVVDGISLHEFAQQVVEHLRGVMYAQMAGDVALLADRSQENIQQVQRHAHQMEQTRTLYAIKRFSQAIPELKGGLQPQLPLELALIESIRGEATPVAAAPETQSAAAGSPSAVVEPRVAEVCPADSPTEQAAESQGTQAAPTQATQDERPAQAERRPAQPDRAGEKRLQARWNEFLSEVKGRCGIKAEAALRSVRDIAVAEHTVAFAFGNNRFSRDIISEPDFAHPIGVLLSQYLGRTISLECQEGSQARLSVTAGTVVQDDSDGPDPLVEYALAELGAEVVE